MAKKGDNIYKRKDGRWEGRFFISDEQGTKKYKSVYAKTKKEVKEKLSMEKKKMQKDIKLTVVAEEWLEYKKKHIKKISYDNYRFNMEKIIQYFKNYKLADISEDVIKKYAEYLKRSGLSEKSSNHILKILKAIISFNEKGKEDEISENVTNSSSKMKILKQEEIEILVKYCSAEITPCKVIILLAISTGVKLSELCALKWSDINLQKRTITVKKIAERIYDSDGSTKLVIRDIDERIVYIPLKIIKILKKVKNKKGYVNSGNKNMLDPRSLQRALKICLDEIKVLPKLTFLEIRDNFALHALESGVDVRMITQNMGVSFYSMEKYFEIINRQPEQEEIDKIFL